MGRTGGDFPKSEEKDGHGKEVLSPQYQSKAFQERGGARDKEKPWESKIKPGRAVHEGSMVQVGWSSVRVRINRKAVEKSGKRKAQNPPLLDEMK